MEMVEAAFLSLLQVSGELWPIDASGQIALGFSSANLTESEVFSVLIFAQIGMVLALMVILHRDFFKIGHGIIRILKGRSAPELSLLGKMIVTSFPALLILAACFVWWFPNVPLLAIICISIVCAIVLFLTDLMGVTVRRLEHLDWNSSLLFSLMQILALIPGTSRLGLTISMARFFGYERPDSVRVGYLLSFLFWALLIPMELWVVSQNNPLTISLEDIQIVSGAFVISLIAGYGLLWWVRHHTMWPFVIWRFSIAFLALIALA